MASERLPGLTLARILRPWGRRGEVAAEILTDFPERLLALKQAYLCDGDTQKPPSDEPKSPVLTGLGERRCSRFGQASAVGDEPKSPVRAGLGERRCGRFGQASAVGDEPKSPVRGASAVNKVSILSCRIHLGQAIFHFSGVDSISDAEKLRGLELQVPLAERAAVPPGRYYVDDLVGCEVWEQGADAPLGAVREVQNTADAGAAESWLLAVDTPRGELLIPLAAEICTRIDTQARRIEVRLLDGLRDLNR